MDIEIQWSRELPLKRNSRSGLYEINLEKIPEVPGVYIFGRRHGAIFEALYVGKSADLRSRIKTQLNNHKLLTHVWNAKDGGRALMFGEFKAKPKQNHADCLRITEKALIRHFKKRRPR